MRTYFAHSAFVAATLSLGLSSSVAAETPVLGINLSSAEFSAGSAYGWWWPEESQYAKVAEKGIKRVRLPILWERLQPDLQANLDNTELANLKAQLDTAAKYKLEIVLDVHNFGTYKGQSIGSASVPEAALPKFVKLLAVGLWNKPALKGYDIMNEPNIDGDVWRRVSNAAVKAIRSIDANAVRTIWIEGVGSSSSGSWSYVNPAPWIDAPNIEYSAHIYFDHNNSGAGGTFAENNPVGGLNEGPYRLDSFGQWCATYKVTCNMGEVGYLNNDPTWDEVFRRYADAAKSYGIKSYLWGGGGHWPSTYELRLWDSIDDGGADGRQWPTIKEKLY